MTLNPKNNIESNLLFWLELYINDKKAHNFSLNTITMYKKCLLEFCEYCNLYEVSIQEELNDFNSPLLLENITREIIIDFLNSQENKSYSKNTINIYIRAIKSFFKFISSNNDEKKDIYKNIINIKESKSQTIKESFTTDEKDKIRSHLIAELNLTKSFLKFRNALLLTTLLYTGLRISELINLSFEDIIVENEELYKLNILGKGDKPRTIYLNRILFEPYFNKLKSFKQNLNITSNIVFTTKDGNKLSYENIFRVNKNILKKLNIKNRSGLHIYRHTYARDLVSRNINLETIKELLGHSDISITSRYYAKTNEENKKRVVFL